MTETERPRKGPFVRTCHRRGADASGDAGVPSTLARAARTRRIAWFARHANGQTSAERTPASLMLRVPARSSIGLRDDAPTEPRLTASIVLVSASGHNRTDTKRCRRPRRARGITVGQRRSATEQGDRSDCELRLRVAQRRLELRVDARVGGQHLDSANLSRSEARCRCLQAQRGAPMGSVCANAARCCEAIGQAPLEGGIDPDWPVAQPPSGLVGRGSAARATAPGRTGQRRRSSGETEATTTCEHCIAVLLGSRAPQRSSRCPAGQARRAERFCHRAPTNVARRRTGTWASARRACVRRSFGRSRAGRTRAFLGVRAARASAEGAPASLRASLAPVDHATAASGLRSRLDYSASTSCPAFCAFALATIFACWCDGTSS